MKTRPLLLFTTCAAFIGYGLGAISTDEAGTVTTTKSEAPTPTATGPGGGASALRMDGPFSQVFSALKTRQSLEDLARIGDALAGLDSARFPELLAAIVASSHVERWRWLTLVLEHWFANDPEAAARWVLAKAEQFKAHREFGHTGHERQMLRLLAKYRSEEALALARRNAGKPLGGYLLEELGRMSPPDQRREILQTIESFPTGPERGSAVTELFMAWAKDDPHGALAAVPSLPVGPERTQALFRTLRGLTKSDPEAAFDQLLSLTGAEAVLAQAAVLPTIPSATFAADWLRRHDDAPAVIAERLVGKWAEAEPAAALEWARVHGVSLIEFAHFVPPGEVLVPYRSNDYTDSGYAWVYAPLVSAFQHDGKQAAAWLLQQPSGPETDALIQIGLSHVGAQSPDVARDLFAKLSPEGQAQLAHRMLVDQYGKNADAARAWVDGLPSGPVREAAWEGYGRNFPQPAELPPGSERDAMLDGLANRNGNNPEKAWAWIEQIQNPTRRREIFDATMWGALKEQGPGDAAKAREFLKASTTVPAEWKERWMGK